MPDGYMDAAAVPVPDQMADALQSALPLATFLAPNKLPLDARDVAQMQAHRLRGQGYHLTPVPHAGDDTLRDEMARTITASLHGGRWIDMTPRKIADALLPLIRGLVAAAVQAERERVSALLASIPDEYYPTDVFGGPLSTDESRQANELLKAEGLPTFDRISANVMRHAYRNAARLTLEEPDDDR